MIDKINRWLGVYAAQPREGTETQPGKLSNPSEGFSGLCSSTPRGDGNKSAAWSRVIPATQSRFMQLNPARGRKLEGDQPGNTVTFYGLCSSTPRGDGNPIVKPAVRRTGLWFMQLNPARGRKQIIRNHTVIGNKTRFMQLNPARGRKLRVPGVRDGGRVREVYAAQPREGTETGIMTETCFPSSSWFMQLNPARGRKLAHGEIGNIPLCNRFMQLNPARGRKPLRDLA